MFLDSRKYIDTNKHKILKKTMMVLAKHKKTEFTRIPPNKLITLKYLTTLQTSKLINRKLIKIKIKE